MSRWLGTSKLGYLFVLAWATFGLALVVAWLSIVLDILGWLCIGTHSSQTCDASPDETATLLYFHIWIAQECHKSWRRLFLWRLGVAVSWDVGLS